MEEYISMSNYQTDLFLEIVKAMYRKLGVPVAEKEIEDAQRRARALAKEKNAVPSKE